MNALDTLLKGIATLPSLPAVALKIIQEAKKSKSSIRELADIISYDPALTAKILRIANSSFYALPYKVDSIERAVNILGLEALKNIALSFAIVKGFRRNPVDEFDHELFWKRSLTAAVSAGMIASKLRMKRDDTFVTPLLMDIGVLVMYTSKPEDYLKVIDEKRISHATTVEAERAVFGFDHQEVGGEILKKWGIPENIYLPITYHHRSSECPQELLTTVNMLMLSDLASSIYHSNKSLEKVEELKRLLKDKLNITDDEISEFIDSVAEKTIEILSTFEIDPGNMKPYSQILQEANEELGKLNLSYEQLVMELKQEKKKVENLAKELKKANEKLSGLAFRDGLTGIFNHRFFQELLDKEVGRADRYRHPLSLIIFDIDHFKKVNDTFGHPRGDIVLRFIGDLLNRAIRTPDTAARYGGEEFAVVLPETDLKGAVVVAERLREAVEKLEIKLDDQPVKLTISLGVTSYEPQKGHRTKTDIVEAADKALYNSKMTGRNRISIVSLHSNN
ncbi:MAG: HDOD domain-containing protein [Nitrospirae bacterium]|nr:HDOD domain-containing protein [Nitrospirota bacterium]